VTFLWSTSWVFIKIGLHDIHIPALIFAGLRYGVAFLVLLAYGQHTNRLDSLKKLSRRDWRLLVVLGIVFYTITQGTQFLALVYLPSAMFSLILNFTSIVVALAGIKLLKEYPTRIQWAGIALFIVGVLTYLYPINFPSEIMLGLLIGATSTLANAGASILGRYVNRESTISPFTVTLVSMGVGAGLLLVVGAVTEELTPIPLEGWIIILWMAAINTAFAFTLWNVTLQTLSATESSIINNTMLIQIALLAWLFLGETITPKEVIGLLLATAGILIVQVWRRKK
jgi:drug/metabolite transporter (DMT)-like permease